MIEIKCPYCKQPFLSLQGKVRKLEKLGLKLYCSKACSFLGRRKKREILICPQCNASFSNYPSRLKKSRKREDTIYCSKECSFLGRRNRVTVLCGTCNIPITRQKSRNRKYCSKECFGKAKRSKYFKIWKEHGVSYTSLHKWVRRQLGSAHHCEHCGLEKIPKGKKRYFQWANKSHDYRVDISDWVSLCLKCHKAYDKKQLIV